MVDECKYNEHLISYLEFVKTRRGRGRYLMEIIKFENWSRNVRS